MVAPMHLTVGGPCPVAPCRISVDFFHPCRGSPCKYLVTCIRREVVARGRGTEGMNAVPTFNFEQQISERCGICPAARRAEHQGEAKCKLQPSFAS